MSETTGPRDLPPEEAIALFERTHDALVSIAAKQLDFRTPIREAAELEKRAALQLQHWVKMAKGLGATWVEIGEWLGVSRQAAQQRFGRLVQE